MSQVIKNPSPKSRFQENPQNVTKHRELLELPQLQRSLDAAMLQYQAALTNNMPSDLSGASAVGRWGSRPRICMRRGSRHTPGPSVVLVTERECRARCTSRASLR